ncbi:MULTISPECIES: transposase [unclassified Micromonospora]|uniref:IS110 family transposase n=1 Tax=unclassified Micromonospora TaxID=2617518 RepID=UPI00363072B1
MAKLWIGVDIGKTHHHVAAVDGGGRLVYSRRVANDETTLLTVMAEVSTHGRASAGRSTSPPACPRCC